MPQEEWETPDLWQCLLLSDPKKWTILVLYHHHLMQNEIFTYFLFKSKLWKRVGKIKRIQFHSTTQVTCFLILPAQRLLSQEYYLGKRLIIGYWITPVLYQEEEHLFSLLMGYRFPRLPNLSSTLSCHIHT